MIVGWKLNTTLTVLPNILDWPCSYLDEAVLQMKESTNMRQEWHLCIRCKQAIPRQKTFDFADKTRRFRHVAVRSYDSFLPQYADVSVSLAESLSDSLLPELIAFQALVDG